MQMAHFHNLDYRYQISIDKVKCMIQNTGYKFFFTDWRLDTVAGRC